MNLQVSTGTEGLGLSASGSVDANVKVKGGPKVSADKKGNSKLTVSTDTEANVGISSGDGSIEVNAELPSVQVADSCGCFPSKKLSSKNLNTNVSVGGDMNLGVSADGQNLKISADGSGGIGGANLGISSDNGGGVAISSDGNIDVTAPKMKMSANLGKKSGLSADIGTDLSVSGADGKAGLKLSSDNGVGVNVSGDGNVGVDAELPKVEVVNGCSCFSFSAKNKNKNNPKMNVDVTVGGGDGE